ncbi:MAG: hypothetical protein JETT_3817 [Candidatus Jettenia ecosi]|uniref:Uncharacterized protein n=1 Tax=Candidatus Jettenia ecosi TaxID=2494326 RepID=A0A533Q5T9_9BACT|nr:MAG: hypothetical protein JETT_3817 [Candidatus Jettenia ecosi]
MLIAYQAYGSPEKNRTNLLSGKLLKFIKTKDGNYSLMKGGSL